jgi:hypothetical protein
VAISDPTSALIDVQASFTTGPLVTGRARSASVPAFEIEALSLGVTIGRIQAFVNINAAINTVPNIVQIRALPTFNANFSVKAVCDGITSSIVVRTRSGQCGVCSKSNTCDEKNRKMSPTHHCER